jgi:hypothetical protein
MLPNCDDVFISQSSSRKILELLEDLIASSRHLVVRERVLELLAAGAYVQRESRTIPHSPCLPTSRPFALNRGACFGQLLSCSALMRSYCS